MEFKWQLNNSAVKLNQHTIINNTNIRDYRGLRKVCPSTIGGLWMMHCIISYCRMKLSCARGSQLMCWNMTWWQKKISLSPWMILQPQPHPLRIPEMTDQWIAKDKQFGNNIVKPGIMEEARELAGFRMGIWTFKDLKIVGRSLFMHLLWRIQPGDLLTHLTKVISRTCILPVQAMNSHTSANNHLLWWAPL